MNNSIEAFRFLFICQICLFHCPVIASWLIHGNIAVEFFFILSGFFIYSSYERHPDMGVLDFMLKRIKRMIVPFYISLIMLMLLDRKRYFYISDFSPDCILEKYFCHIHEFLFCQCLGLTETIDINYPLWFVSVMLFGGTILYGLLRNYPKSSTSLLIPVICLFGYSFLLSNGNCRLQNSRVLLGMQAWMIRGLVDMGLGIMVSVFMSRKRNELGDFRFIIDTFAIISCFGMMLLSVAQGNYDYLALFFVPIIIVSCMCEKSIFHIIFRHKVWSFLGGLSMYMYFIHLFVLSIYWIIREHPLLVNISNNVIIIIYIISIIICAFILKTITIRTKKINNESAMVYK